MTTRSIGFDSHKREATFCIIDAAGKELLTRTFALTRESLLQFAQTTLQPTDRLALEATTNCWIVAELLRPFVAEVVVSNPMATKAIASAKVKTDKVDALVLAQLLRCDYLPAVWQPDAATQQLRQLTGRRASLVQQRTALRNRIHSVLAMRLIAETETLFSTKGRDWLLALLREERIDAEGKLLIESELDLLEQVQRQIDRLDQELLQRGYRDDRVRLLLTLPGVDVTTAETLLAALGDVSRFPTPEQAAAYLGLVPSTRQSAQRCYHGPITKRGNTQGAVDAGAGRAVGGPASRTAGRVLPPIEAEEEPQRRRRGRGPQTGDHRLAHADHGRALPLRAAELDAAETGPAADQGHRRQANLGTAEGGTLRGQTPRRLADRQAVGPGL